MSKKKISTSEKKVKTKTKSKPIKKKGGQEKAKLKYEPQTYTPYGLKLLDEKLVRKEYSRLRAIAIKRLERFKGTEWETSETYRLNANIYKKLKDIKSQRELGLLLTQLARFISADTGSVSGLNKQRDKALKTMHSRGHTFVNKTNFRQFAEFMEYSRIANGNRLYDSERVADFFETMEKRNLSKTELQEAFRAWSRNQRKKKKMVNKNHRNSNLYRQDED